MTQKFNIKEQLSVFLIILVIVVAQLLLLKKLGLYEVILGINGIILVVFLLINSTKKFYNILIVIYFLPLLLLNNNLHYSFKVELVFALPLFLLGFYTLFLFILRNQKEKTNSDLTRPVLLFVFYFLFSAVLGLSFGNNMGYILVETFHVLLLGSIILFKYNLTSREDYYYIFKWLLIISLLISLEYIFFGILISGNRFVTFQSGFLPLVTGILFSYFLFTENKFKKIIVLGVIIIVILGMISTLTRSLWVTTIITMGMVYVLYLWSKNMLTTVKKIVLVILMIVVSLLVIQTVKNTKPNNTISTSKNLDERAQSIANPSEDHSFLMRVELGWYAIQKITEKPIFGWGLGDVLQYRLLGNNKLRNSYLDTVWLYFLWKGGIIGLLLILFVFFRSIVVSLRIISKTSDQNVKILIVGLLSGIIGILILGFLSPLIIKYRTNVIFAFIWAYLEFELNKLKITGKIT